MSYITEEDIASGKVKVVPENERNKVNYATEDGSIREKGMEVSMVDSMVDNMEVFERKVSVCNGK